ncbi:FtsQ-type POTRA domain-containing protein [Desulfococcaceae bacterium HSG9]|nr:FtsQ-type POTRA domain-containing protein [Desulfococcaceae bacterium HSG9]
MTSKIRNKPKNAFTIHTLKWQDRNYFIFAFIFKIGVCIFIISAMGIIFIFGYNYLTQCHYFKTDNVDISGTRLLSPSHLLTIAQIEASVNVLAVNLKRTRKLLLSNSWIAEATVTRRIPSELTIHVVEHKPLAILELVGTDHNAGYIINERGKIFQKWPVPKSQSLNKAIIAQLPIMPIITGLDYSDLDRSGQPSGRQFNAVMEMLHLGQKADAFIPNKDIKKILIDKEIGLTLYTNARSLFKRKSDNAVDVKDVKINAIRIGYGDYAAKLARLRQIIDHLRSKYDMVEFAMNKDITFDIVNLSRIIARPIYIKARVSDHSET